MKCIGCDKECTEYTPYPRGPLCSQCSPAVEIISLKEEISELKEKNNRLLYFKIYYDLEFNMTHGKPLIALAVNNA